MGLKLSYTLATGVTGDHWSIGEHSIDPKTKSCHFYLRLFLSSSAKDSGKAPLAQCEFTWTEATCPDMFNETILKSSGTSPRTIAYSKIKGSGEDTNRFALDFTQSVDED